LGVQEGAILLRMLGLLDLRRMAGGGVESHRELGSRAA